MPANPMEEIRKLFENSPFVNFLGVQIVQFEEGKVVLELPVRRDLINVNQTVHGGVFASLLDNILGMTIRSLVKKPLATVNLQIHFLESLKQGKMVATAQVLKKGNRLVTAEGEIRDGEERLLAKGIGTFKVLREE
jgi:uncharacterized protein (TIGR00369 family)